MPNPGLSLEVPSNGGSHDGSPTSPSLSPKMIDCLSLEAVSNLEGSIAQSDSRVELKTIATARSRSVGSEDDTIPRRRSLGAAVSGDMSPRKLTRELSSGRDIFIPEASASLTKVVFDEASPISTRMKASRQLRTLINPSKSPFDFESRHLTDPVLQSTLLRKDTLVWCIGSSRRTLEALAKANETTDQQEGAGDGKGDGMPGGKGSVNNLEWVNELSLLIGCLMLASEHDTNLGAKRIFHARGGANLILSMLNIRQLWEAALILLYNSRSLEEDSLSMIELGVVDHITSVLEKSEEPKMLCHALRAIEVLTYTEQGVEAMTPWMPTLVPIASPTTLATSVEVVVAALNVLWNMTELVGDFRNAHTVSLNLGLVGSLKAIIDSDDLDGADIVAPFAVLKNLSRNPECVPAIVSSGIPQLLLKEVQDEGRVIDDKYAMKALKHCVTCSLAFLLGKEEGEVLNVFSDAEVVRYILEKIRVQLRGSAFEEFYQFSLEELLQALGILCMTELHARKAVDEDCINTMISVFTGAEAKVTERDKGLGAKIIWRLTFVSELRDAVSASPQVIELLRTMKETSSDIECRRNAESALFVLVEESQRLEKNHEGQQGHIMISYCWTHQPLILQLRNLLRKAGFTVWIDVDDMQGSTIEAMAAAVDNACAIVICVSPQYQDSASCRLELEYAYQQRKPLVPVMMDSSFQPKGWLGAIMGTKLYFLAETETMLQQKAPALIKTLKQYDAPRRPSTASTTGGASMGVGTVDGQTTCRTSRAPTLHQQSVVHNSTLEGTIFSFGNSTVSMDKVKQDLLLLKEWEQSEDRDEVMSQRVCRNRATWTPLDVATLLVQEGMGHHAKSFLSHHISGRVLQRMARFLDEGREQGQEQEREEALLTFLAERLGVEVFGELLHLSELVRTCSEASPLT